MKWISSSGSRKIQSWVCRYRQRECSAAAHTVGGRVSGLSSPAACLIWIGDEIAIDAALENRGGSDDQVVSIEVGKASNAVTQFVGDNIDFKHCIYSRKHTFSFNGLDQCLWHQPCQIHRQQLSTGWSWRNLTKLRSWSEVKILPFTNRKQIGINSIKFLPIAELSSSVTHNQELLTPVIHSGQQDGWSKPRIWLPTYNWSGWVTSIHADNVKQNMQIDFLPVIKDDPNDHSNIFTTLKECMRYYMIFRSGWRLWAS